MSTGSEHEKLEGIHAATPNPKFLGIGEKYSIYHGDSMLRGGPALHFLKALDVSIPPWVVSSELLAPHHFFTMGCKYQSVDTILGKGDTRDR